MRFIPRRAEPWNLPERYELRELIGTGSMGSVREAFDREKEQYVAIKRIRHLFEDTADCKRVLRDIAILSQLDHAYIL